MKKWILFLLTLVLVQQVLGQSAKSTDVVCHTAATTKFAMFASNKDFNAAHPKPRIYFHQSQNGGKMIQFDTPDGGKGNGYVIMAKAKTDNWIFVFQEWWGLNDNIKRQAEDLYKDLGNVNILAIDLYDGKVATEREKAAEYMQQFKQERGNNIVLGAIKYVGKKAKIGTIGWCFGGGQSLLAALTAKTQTAACVIYYGMPVEDVAVLKTLNSDVLGIFASREQWITPAVVAKFEANMKAAGKKVTIKSYDAEHGFANPSNPMGAFDEKAYADAYQATLAYFKSKF